MFRRRKNQPITERVRGLVWPQMGWRRAGAYIWYRLKRLPGTPHAIAAGFACGAAVSFTPFVGLHFLFGALLAWIIGGNIMASVIGTAVGNPWTFPFIWVGIYQSGCLILGWEPGHALSETLSMDYIIEHPSAILAPAILVPMTLGSIPVAAVVWAGFYVLVRGIVDNYQALRRKRQAKRQAKLAAAAEINAAKAADGVGTTGRKERA